jgi:hypothetical protein
MRASSTATAPGAMRDGIDTMIEVEGARFPVPDAIHGANRILASIGTRWNDG